MNQIVTNKQQKLILQIKADLERHEGFREFAYPDPLSKLYTGHRNEKWGYKPAREILSALGIDAKDAAESGAPWTVGFGFTGGVTLDSRISRLLAERKLEAHILENDTALRTVFGWYETASFPTKTVLINMLFNLGLKGLLGFKNTLAYIKAQNYIQAAANMRKSLWFKQTGRRAQELSKRMETQQIEPRFLAPEKL